MMAILSAPFLAWRGIHPMTLGDIIMFPGMVAFTALMFHAALHGGRHEFAKRVEGRPLARNVWNFYVLVLLAYWIFK